MADTVPVELLYAALGLCSSLVGVLLILLRREKKNNHGHNPGNPGIIPVSDDVCGGRVAGLVEKLVEMKGIQEAAADTLKRIEGGQDKGNDLLIKIADRVGRQ
jgi:hypothetical protein